MDGPARALFLGSSTHVGKAARLWPGRSSSYTRTRDRLRRPRSPHVRGRNFSRNTSTLDRRLVLLPEACLHLSTPRFDESFHDHSSGDLDILGAPNTGKTFHPVESWQTSDRVEFLSRYSSQSDNS